MSVNLNATSIVQYIAFGVSISALAATITGAMKAGVLKRIKFGNIEIESLDQYVSEGKQIIDRMRDHNLVNTPYEIEQLAKYYAQILSQSKISFWFSLIFASLGFTVIIIAAIFYSNEKVGTTIASFIAGIIIDAVSALFFVQSKSAQKAMSDFFDKLRRDRDRLEARKICEEIHNPDAKDALRVQLSLNLAGVSESKDIGHFIIKGCLNYNEIKR